MERIDTLTLLFNILPDTVRDPALYQQGEGGVMNTIANNNILLTVYSQFL